MGIDGRTRERRRQVKHRRERHDQPLSAVVVIFHPGS